MDAKKRASLLSIPFPSGNFLGESCAVTHLIKQTFVLCQALSVNRTGYATSATGNSAVVVFKQPLESRLPTVLYFSHLSLTATLPQHESWDISLQGGNTPFAQLCKCSERHARRVDGISSPCMSAPQPSACPFPLPWKRGAVLPPHFFPQPHHHSHSPPT